MKLKRFLPVLVMIALSATACSTTTETINRGIHFKTFTAPASGEGKDNITDLGPHWAGDGAKPTDAPAPQNVRPEDVNREIMHNSFRKGQMSPDAPPSLMPHLGHHSFRQPATSTSTPQQYPTPQCVPNGGGGSETLG